ncbi:nitroreductase family protein [Ureibacillus manganicus]|uniref:nitroreductase family protein n=1 Tax=Ureibacillus manganicus TaxID=1266064 RepID=UPI000A6455EA|nr:nitroreductase family protein [Ureibacillus manganicus]
MINFIKKIIPKPIKKKLLKQLQIINLEKNYKLDMEKFKKYSFEFGFTKEKRHHEADLIFFYHKIEKGLSLPNPRVGFGEENVEYLLSKLENYVDKYHWDDTSIITLNTLYAYYDFNKDNNLILDDLFNRIEKLSRTLPKENTLSTGGIIELKKEQIDKSGINFKDFAYSRYSIRDFAPGDVNLELIKESVQIAQKTPSVCNRQSSKVYVYSDEVIKKEVLKYQNGNAGFGDRASKILIVTCELKDFRGVIERNQSYIDGGMYSMSLIYALHSLGVGTCALNLSVTNETEQALKRVARIGESEVLLMMIAVGNLPERLKVAASPRREAEEVMTVIYN